MKLVGRHNWRLRFWATFWFVLTYWPLSALCALRRVSDWAVNVRCDNALRAIGSKIRIRRSA